MGAFFTEADCDLAAFEAQISKNLRDEDVPLASRIEKNVPIYDGNAVRAMLLNRDEKQSLMSEWAHGLAYGAGVVAVKGALTDHAMIDAVSDVFRTLIREEKDTATGGDHFAAAGTNDRVWNAAEKLMRKDPALFARYFGNTAIAGVCEAWLGPAYQMTAQVNLVRPGGQAQAAHRDYHLGFQKAQAAAKWPKHTHLLTAALTLQGAVAHCDMPVASGPTKLLPFSQDFEAGYLAFHREDFRAVFEKSYIQLPLEKGDAVFFNPALFHAAGANSSQDIHRMANLLQISSAFGRAMEALDRMDMARRLYPVLRDMVQSGEVDAEMDAAIAACAEGYPFPTNLDTDPPIAGNAPESDADLMRRALSEGLSADEFNAQLTARYKARHP